MQKDVYLQLNISTLYIIIVANIISVHVYVRTSVCMQKYVSLKHIQTQNSVTYTLYQKQCMC